MDNITRSQMIERYSNSKSYKLDFEKMPMDSKVVLGCFDIPVTTKCTLRCKHCSSLMPYYKSTQNFDMAQLLNDVQKLIDNVDYVPRINVLGGEPFLHPELYKLLHLLNDNSKVEKVRIITNGTVIPHNSPELIHELLEPKMQVRISHYTLGNVDAKKFALFLDANHVQYTFKEFGENEFQWFDFGDFGCRNRTAEELLIQKNKCDVEWYSYLDGKLFCCPRAAHATDANLIAISDSNYFDVRNSTSNTKMDLFRYVMGNRPGSACNHCDRGTANCKIVKVAEQF